jgi:lysophospholipase L1-like esterase
MLRLGLRIATACLWASGLYAASPAPFYLKDGDRVVFYGDSITDQRLYTVYTELYAVTRYPGLDVMFVHSGWGGDRVTGGGGGPVDLRLKRDVFAYQPTVVTIMLGMNDGSYTGHKPENDETYKTGYQHIVQSLRQQIQALRITAIEPSPFDDVTRPFTLQPDGYNAVLASYGKWIEGYAKETTLDVADLNAGVVAMLRNADLADHNNASKIIPDRVHPGPGGHLIMAEQLLKAWNARPVVSAVSINAEGTPAVSDQQFAKVSGLLKESGLRWTEIDEALPLPLQPMAEADNTGAVALALKSSDIWSALNQETLRVTGLATGHYTLRIDSKGVGEFTNAQLGEGINLAMYVTPMTEQAMTVLNLTTSHNQIHFERWRHIQVPLQDKIEPSLDGALAAMDRLEADIVRQQREASHPKPHQFELTPVAQ